jgi:3-oxoacyl-(acyl-carrier-protein) synthase
MNRNSQDVAPERETLLIPVVVTGIGAITSRGDFTADNLASLPQSTLDGAPQATFAIADFDLAKYLSSPKTYLDRCSALALAGCALALRGASIEHPVEASDADHFGITLGTHFGCIETMRGFLDKAAERGVRMANAVLFSHSYVNSPISLCAIEYGLKGYHSTLCAGASSGIEAVRAAHDAIALGHVEAMLCGGVEAVSPTRSDCAPDDADGEAGVFFVLESAEHAARRGAKVLYALKEEVFESLPMLDSRAVFGSCGGAQSALQLAAAFAAQASG